MSKPEEQGFLLADILRRLNNIIRLGKVVKVDYAAAKAKVKIGELETTFLPWLVGRAGTDISWRPIDVGEHVIVLSPNGELNSGVIIPSLYQSKNPAPTKSKDKHKMVFADGTMLEYDKAAKTLTASFTGDVNITIAGNANITASTATIKAAQTTVDGDATITGNATVNGMVALAGGGPAVARAGDAVAVDPITHQGTILAGSGKVNAGG